jgi:transcriptional regulator with XRE-family HTH domain
MPDAKLGNRIRELRLARKLTQEQLSAKLKAAGLSKGTSPQHISAVELGNAWPSPKLVETLDTVFGSKPELIYLLRGAKVPTQVASSDESIDVTAHLFFPLYLEALPAGALTAHVSGSLDFVPRLGKFPCESEVATLHGFPFHVVVLHEAHNLVMPDLSAIAAWRQKQIARCGTATQEAFDRAGLSIAHADHDPYCFTVFVINAGPWADEVVRGRATHILAMPNVLLATHDGGESQDRANALLGSATPIDDVVDFSLTGSHFGAASWAAVAVSPSTHVTKIAHALVELEVQLQAIWCYSSNVETQGAFVHDDFDYQFLRRVLGKLQRPMPTEPTAVRRLREAIFHTSRIAHLIGAIEVMT